MFSRLHSQLGRCDTLFPLHFAEWPHSPGSANQIDRLTSISWSTRSEHLNVFWCNNKVCCRGVTKCPGSMIFPGPVLFALGFLICRWLTNRKAGFYCCTGFALMHSRIFAWFHTAAAFMRLQAWQKKKKKRFQELNNYKTSIHTQRGHKSAHERETCWSTFLCAGLKLFHKDDSSLYARLNYGGTSRRTL